MHIIYPFFTYPPQYLYVSGIGQLFHTSPTVPHYPGNKSKGRMEVGHVFTIEPMINIGRAKDGLWPDG